MNNNKKKKREAASRVGVRETNEVLKYFFAGEMILG
jgi:hypothetical protein